MKKILLPLIALAGLAGLIFAAEPFDAATVCYFGGSSAITGVTWTQTVVDTLTLKPLSLTKHIRFTRPLYNVQVRVLNAAGDSGYVTVSAGDWISGIDHAASVSRAYKTFDVWRADTCFFNMGCTGFDLLAKKGGTADSACVIVIEGVR